MQIEMKARYARGPATVHFGRYQENGVLAIQLVCASGIPEPLARATFNPENAEGWFKAFPEWTKDTHVFIKDWSENEGMFKELIRNNVIKPVLDDEGNPIRIAAGFTNGYVGKLTDSGLHAMREQIKEVQP